jgi:PII-like signaling protein
MTSGGDTDRGDDLGGSLRRARIYLNESEWVGHHSAYRAILELLRHEHAVAATVVRGMAGFGESRAIHTDMLADVIEHLPIIIEWLDTPERIEQLLPRIEEMAPHGLITVDDTGVSLYRPRQRLPGAP